MDPKGVVITQDSPKNILSIASEVRLRALAMIFAAQSGHPGGALSAADILATLWMDFLDYHRPEAFSPSSNRFILSKGHSVPALYALASLTGILGWGECLQFRQSGSKAQGHPHVKDLPWLETSTGSLGQGFSFSSGLALSKKMRAQEGQVFCLVGDGEVQEGQVWETLMFAAHQELNNLVMIIDRNGLQSDSSTEEVVRLESLGTKLEAFGWSCVEINGHEYSELSEALSTVSNKPRAIIAKTTKGKGVTFMEDAPEWHGSVAMTENQYLSAASDLGFSRGHALSILTRPHHA